MSTMDNVGAAFAGESQANRKYLAFSEKATQEGFPAVAKLFRAASDAEAIHARTLLGVMGASKSTAENLAGSVAGETHEFTEMYPAFIAEAEREGQKAAITPFTYAMKAEEVHAGLLREGGRGREGRQGSRGEKGTPLPRLRKRRARRGARAVPDLQRSRPPVA